MAEAKSRPVSHPIKREAEANVRVRVRASVVQIERP